MEGTIDLPQVTEKLNQEKLHEEQVITVKIKVRALEVIGTDCIHKCKTNCMIMATTGSFKK